jgi:putative spermidine/putrescine transport system ATP-binding protein
MNDKFSQLRLEGVARSYGDTVALTDMNLTVDNGEFIAFLGPSGCGKTTALNCLAGLLPLSAGSISMDDRRVDRLPPERRDFGMVFQNYALFPHLSVYRNVAFGLQMRKVPKSEIRRRVAATLELVQLTDQADKRPGQLSGGQQQRVAIARAIVMEPQLVLMDEPLSNLDAKLRREMRVELRRLHRELGLTTIYVTHDQEEALSLADRLVVLRDGRIQQIGQPEEVYRTPSNAFVAGFMGYRNMLTMTASASETVSDGLHLSGHGLTLTGLGQERGPVTLAIRPDDIVIGEHEGNCIQAVVEEVEFQGREYDLLARTASNTVLHIRTDQHVAVGESVELGVRRDRLMVYPAGSAEPRPDQGALGEPLCEAM